MLDISSLKGETIPLNPFQVILTYENNLSKSNFVYASLESGSQQPILDCIKTAKFSALTGIILSLPFSLSAFPFCFFLLCVCFS